MNQSRETSARRWRFTIIVLIASVLCVIALVGIIRVVYRYGFTAETGTLITAWATIVAVVIAQIVTAWLAAERAQVEAQQAYLKEMGDLLSQSPEVRDLAAANQHDLRTLARAHTLTVLSGLSPARREVVYDYLRETRLLEVLGLPGALETHTSQASLGGPVSPRVIEADLHGAHLGQTNLQGADLQWANLAGAHLRNVNLNNANLQGTQLNGASLYTAKLQEANLRGVNLRGALLEVVDLQ